MKKISTKITTLLLICILLYACDSTKRVPLGKQLLQKNEIRLNDKFIKDDLVTDLLYQQPNSSVLNFRLRLHLFNLANPNIDSSFQSKFIENKVRHARLSKLLSEKQLARLGNSFWYKGFHEFLKKTGETPVIIDTLKMSKSAARLQFYYFNSGFFDTKANYTLDSISPKKAIANYNVSTGLAYFVDSIKTSIKTPVLDSIYKSIQNQSIISLGKQYKTSDFEDEKNRISTHFRNNGVYHFQPNYISFDLDTIGKNHKVDVNLKINDFQYQDQDSSRVTPFKVYKISNVNIYTDYSAANANNPITDSTQYKDFNLYSHSKLKYKPKAITDAVFISKGGLFSDTKTVLTTRYLNNLKIFGYPTVLYKVDPRDLLSQSLIADIYLSPRKKYSLSPTFNTTRSNIQTIGFEAGLTGTIRNIFNGAETLEISARGNIGSSKQLANPGDNFFNVTEYGGDLKLNIPRIWFPFVTEKIVPKSMIPSTQITAGLSSQTNIGLDKENFTAAFTYNWTPKKNNTARLDLFNLQYVRNLNQQNYFRVYESSYNALNALAKTYNTNPNFVDANSGNLIIQQGTSGFTNAVLSGGIEVGGRENFSTINSIEERRRRLTENDFILASSYTFSKTTKTEDKDNNFYLFKTKIESAGSLLSLFANTSNLPKNNDGNYKIFNLEYSEYFKAELDFVKHWDLSKEKVIAFRTFFGMAIPFGNATNIPFSRSYFAGGSNDNRAWRPYGLGPGSTSGVNDFNEANLKIALSTEFRFKILGSLKGALFADAGNIWNVFDDFSVSESKFNNLSDLNELALGTGFGLRYDFSFFVVRFDLGFKTYNPANVVQNRWFNEYDFANSVLNFGINYPF